MTGCGWFLGSSRERFWSHFAPAITLPISYIYMLYFRKLTFLSEYMICIFKSFPIHYIYCVHLIFWSDLNPCMEKVQNDSFLGVNFIAAFNFSFSGKIYSCI